MEVYTISATSQKLVNELGEKFGIIFRPEESQRGMYYFYGTKEEYPCSTTFYSWSNVRQYLNALKSK